MPNGESSQDGIVDAISILLVARRKTRKWLAEQVGRDQFWIGHRMSGRVMFKFAEVEQIARVFGLDVASLIEVPDSIPGARATKASAGVAS